jgi:hypothetical protein
MNRAHDLVIAGPKLARIKTRRGNINKRQPPPPLIKPLQQVRFPLAQRTRSVNQNGEFSAHTHAFAAQQKQDAADKTTALLRWPPLPISRCPMPAFQPIPPS